MPVELPSGSVSRASAETALGMLRQWPAALMAAIDAFNGQLLPLANVLLAATNDPRAVSAVRGDVDQVRRIIDRAQSNVQRAYDFAAANNILGQRLTAPLADYWRNAFNEDQIRLLLWGFVLGVHTTDPARTIGVYFRNTQDVPEMIRSMVDRYRRASGVTPQQATQILTGQPATTTPTTPSPQSTVNALPVVAPRGLAAALPIFLPLLFLLV